MKKILVAFFLAISLCAIAQSDTAESKTDSVEVQFVRLPDSTAIGKPNGKKVSKEIGPKGGTIVSDDGKVKLIFPADALNKATEISIQPVECLIPNGNKAYQFEPSGIQFQKPVQIIFHYTDEEAEICPPELKFMALQDHKGKWEYLDYNDWDSTTKSLKGFIKHFSAFVDGNEVEFNKTEITLKVGETHFFALNVVQPPRHIASHETAEELPFLPITINRGNRQALWKVNGRTGGSAKHGRIASMQGQAIKATYKAPASLTTDAITVKLQLDTITIREVVQRSRRWRGITRVPTTTNVATFTCKVNLYDEYKITAVAKWQPLLCDAEFVDTSSFIAELFPTYVRIKSKSVNNGSPKLIKPAACSQFEYIPEGCVGPVHINSELVKNYDCSKDYPPKINFEFTSVEVTLLKAIIKVGNVAAPAQALNGESWPGKINFVADGNSTVTGTTSGKMIHKLIIDPVRD